ncbi:adenosylmethionine--8-amino-7-oxononanoate transaminase [bacterium]
MNKHLKNDKKYIWHPYTQMKDHEKDPPILIERAKGLKLYDDKGIFYYDTISSWWCNIHGHNHPKIKNAIKKQLDKFEHVLFAGFTHKPAIELAEKLIKLTPKHLTKVFFSDNGSTAVEVALKMSLQYWQNQKQPQKKYFVNLDMGYHGDTTGAMSVSGLGLFNKAFKTLFFKSFKVSTPYCYRCPMKKELKTCNINCIKPLETLLKSKHKQICGIIIEPLVLCAGGMIVYPKEYLEKMAKLAKKYNVHLILDEIATGFGRTGKMFAFEHVKNIEPDFVCISKGITSGYLPIAATLTTNEIFSVFYDDYSAKKTFYHGHTYTANPLACAAANATIDLFKSEKSLQNAKNLQPLLNSFCKEIKDNKFVGDVRHLGMIVGIEMVKDKKNKRGFDFTDRIGQKIYKYALQNKLLLRPLGNIIYLFLPLSTTKKELAFILDKTKMILNNLENINEK